MRRTVMVAVVLALGGAVGTVRADEKNPTGTWKWTVERQGQKRENTLKLKLDGDKLTGAMVGRDGKETNIEDGTYKDGKVSFTFTREINGNKMVFKYSGTIDGDNLKGKTEFERDGEKQSRDWEAKRSKD